MREINCYSCGAELKKSIGLCQCDYCRNDNLISVLPNGKYKTQIVYVEKSIKKLSEPSKYLIFVVMALLPIFVYRHMLGKPINYTTKIKLANGETICV